ncbi:isochorismate synthase MenF [Roseiflexus sp.]|uniref:isochorismate synthase n=1 Tax=Roseiflexus sp. TaxID=2562120 RepID=UPI00398B5785
MNTSFQQHYGRLISLSMPCPGVSPADLLRHARGQPRSFWESARDRVAFAGMGIAVELMAWGAGRFVEIEQQARALFENAVMLDEREPLAAPRLFGGFAFHDDFVPDLAWADFPPAHFVLPHYQLVRVRDSFWLTLNVHAPLGEDPYALAFDLREALLAQVDLLQSAPPPLSDRSPAHLAYPMPFEQWARSVERIVRQINAGELKKVVLARLAEAAFDQPVDIDHALAYLEQRYPDTYRFLFEPRPGRAFFGATPELLAQVSDDRVDTMALAGSIRRGVTPDEDEQLAMALLDSAKDRHEHQIVVDEVCNRLAPLTIRLNVGTTGVMTLSNIQHLHTPISGTLREPRGILPVVATLHPTPALGGEPREAAMRLIAELEPAPRGWYAAPVGWIDRRLDGQFGVAIRSAVVQSTRAWLYAGAGIVAESDPLREWDETNLKFRPMLEGLGGGH